MSKTVRQNQRPHQIRQQASSYIIWSASTRILAQWHSSLPTHPFPRLLSALRPSRLRLECPACRRATSPSLYELMPGYLLRHESEWEDERQNACQLQELIFFYRSLRPADQLQETEPKQNGNGKGEVRRTSAVDSTSS